MDITPQIEKNKYEYIRRIYFNTREYSQMKERKIWSFGSTGRLYNTNRKKMKDKENLKNKLVIDIHM